MSTIAAHVHLIHKFHVYGVCARCSHHIRVFGIVLGMALRSSWTADLAWAHHYWRWRWQWWWWWWCMSCVFCATAFFHIYGWMCVVVRNTTRSSMALLRLSLVHVRACVLCMDWTIFWVFVKDEKQQQQYYHRRLSWTVLCTGSSCIGYHHHHHHCRYHCLFQHFVFSLSLLLILPVCVWHGRHENSEK